MLKFFLRRAAAAFGLGALLVGAPAAAGHRRRRVPRCGKSRMPTRRSTCSGRSTCFPRIINGVRRSSIKPSQGSQQLVVETIVDDKDPTKIMSAMSQPRVHRPSLAAARRAGAAGKARLRSTRRSRRAAFRPRRSTGWRPGPRPSSCSATSSRHGPQGRRGRRDGASPAISPPRASRSASSKPIVQQFGFFDTLPEKAQRALLEGAVDDSQAADDGIRGHARRPGRAATSTAIARTFDRDLSGSPELRAGADPAAATPIGASGSSSAWPSPARS